MDKAGSFPFLRFVNQIQMSVKLTAAAAWSSLSCSIHLRSVMRMTSRLRHSPRNSSRGGVGGVTGCKSNSFSQEGTDSRQHKEAA